MAKTRTKERNSCEWTYDDGHDFWETECGEAFEFRTGTPKDNKMAFCPFCGRTIVEKEK